MRNSIRTLTVMIGFACASLLVAGVSLTGCDRDKDGERVTTTKGVEGPEGVRPPAAVDDDKLQRDFDEARREYISGTRRQLDELDREIQALDTRVDQLGEDAKKEAREHIDELKEQRKRLADRLDQAERTTRDSWEGFKQETENAWGDFKQSYNRLLEKMKTEK
jgi:hypothetical protein